MLTVTILSISGIANLPVGLIGMSQGIGFLFSTFFDVTGYFLNNRKISLRMTQCIFMAILVINCVGKYQLVFKGITPSNTGSNIEIIYRVA